MKKILIISGGWQGHYPDEISEQMAKLLSKHDVVIKKDLAVLDDKKYLQEQNLLIMNWTRGELNSERFETIQEAVSQGMGLAGVHGGLTSAFQANKNWQFLTGGLFVAHPGGNQTNYKVHIDQPNHPVMKGTQDFSLVSEQYYCLVDPAIDILASTTFSQANHPNAVNGRITLPVAWTKRWGAGRIFYHSLGHDPKVFSLPQVKRWTKQGFEWAMSNQEEEGISCKKQND